MANTAWRLLGKPKLPPRDFRIPLVRIDVRLDLEHGIRRSYAPVILGWLVISQSTLYYQRKSYSAAAYFA